MINQKQIKILMILIVIAVIVGIIFPLPNPMGIKTDVSCKSFSLDVKQNLQDLDQQIEFCEEQCQEINLNLSSSTCIDKKLVCFCL